MSKIDEMDFDSFTEFQCRDWLAENAGWLKPRTNPLAPLNMEWTHNSNEHGTIPFGWDESADVADHPIPASLDEASKLPEGWRLDSVETYSNGYKSGWLATASLITKENPIMGDLTFQNEGETERLARFRLRCAVEAMNNTERKGKA